VRLKRKTLPIPRRGGFCLLFRVVSVRPRDPVKSEPSQQAENSWRRFTVQDSLSPCRCRYGRGKLREAPVLGSLPGHESAGPALDVGERPETVIFQLKNPIRVVEGGTEGSQRHWLNLRKYRLGGGHLLPIIAKRLPPPCGGATHIKSWISPRKAIVRRVQGWYDSGMASSINDQDSRDLELLREIQAAREVFLNSAGDERSIARGHYLKLLKAFSARVFGHEPRIPDQ
jgi:hypothetical protein